MKDKLTVLILFGGASEEYDVSVKSATEIAKHINKQKFSPLYVGITREGGWRLLSDVPKEGWENDPYEQAVLSPDKNMHGLIVFKANDYQRIEIDVVFSVLHGKTGEDGTIQGLLKLTTIPYVGCDIESSVSCMDKALTYLILKQAGFNVPNYFVINDEEDLKNMERFFPCFVKPARSGSSFGITKVEDESALLSAIDNARKFDSKVIVEEAIIGKEIGCAILGNGEKLMTGELDEIVLSNGFFRIHQEETPEKGSENSSFRVPADLPKKTQTKIQQTAKKIYNALGCRGLSRIDMFFKEDGTIILNEVNTLPGFTSYSRYPRMMKAAGITYSDLIESCIILALKG